MTQSARDAVRAKVLAGRTRKREQATLNGEKIEIVQPTVGQVLEVGDVKDSKTRIAKAMIAYIMVPGTDTPLFDDTDLEALCEMPYTPEHLDIQIKMGKLVGGEEKEAIEKNSVKTV